MDNFGAAITEEALLDFNEYEESKSLNSIIFRLRYLVISAALIFGRDGGIID
jgi:hypothetical protein